MTEHLMMKPVELKDEIKHDSNVENSVLAIALMSSDKMSTLSTDIESYQSSNPYDDRFYGEKTNYAEQVSLSRKSYPSVSQPNRAYEAWIKRRATFIGWSELATGQSADELAAAGFIYEGYGGWIKCPW